jgi:putative endonuclease
MTEGAFLYPLRCADGSYYVGTTRTSLEMRIAQHNAGSFGGYTLTRRPVALMYSQWFDRITDAIENERKLKRWTRAKKEAFIRGDMAELRRLSARRNKDAPCLPEGNKTLSPHGEEAHSAVSNHEAPTLASSFEMPLRGSSG